MKKFLAILLAALLVIPAVLVFSASADEVLVSKGKSYTVSGTGIGKDKYTAKLTDGTATEKLSYDDKWFGLYYQTSPDATGINAPDGVGTITIDLGEETANIATYKAHVVVNLGSGIGVPKAVEVSVSNDNKNFTNVGKLSAPAAETNIAEWITLTTEKGVSARYVRFTFKFDLESKAVFVFLDELEVYTDASKESGEPTPAGPSVTAKATVGTVEFDSAKLAKLIDGKRALDASAFSHEDLVSFKNTGFEHGKEEAVDATVEFVYDLGETKKISSVYMDFFKDTNSMIAAPDVAFYASADGVEYYSITNGTTLKTDAAQETKTFTAITEKSGAGASRYSVAARYVKAVASFKNGWIFVSEFGIEETPADYTDATVGIAGPYTYIKSTMTGDSVAVFTKADGELDLASMTDGKLFKNAQLIYAEYDETVKAYKITDSVVNPWPDGHTGKVTLGDNQILVAIATGGYINDGVASSTLKWLARGMRESKGYVVLGEDELYIYPMNHNFSGEPTPVKETITVDGNVDDNGWKADGWKEANLNNSTWQADPAEGITADISYKYQFRADDDKFYVAVIFDGESIDVAEGIEDGNGKGTFVRAWMQSKTAEGYADAVSYTHFYDIYRQGEGTVLHAWKNTFTNEKGNKKEAIANTTGNAASSVKDGKTYYEFSIDLDEFTKGDFQMFLNIGSLFGEGDSTTYLITLHPAVDAPIKDDGKKDLTNFPYNIWNTEKALDVKLADIKLGEIGGDPQPPVDDDPDKKYIEEIIASVGEKNPDGQFDLVIEAPEEYKAGDEITVNVKIKNIKVEEGIVSLLADFYYDNEKLTLLNTADEDGAIECITLPDSWENLVKQDKDEQHNVIDNGHITLAVLTGKKKPVKDDDSLTFTFKFKVKEDAKNAIGFYIPHESVTAKKYDLTDVLGNGGYAITKMHVEGGTSSSSSTAQTGDGSTSMIVFAIVALVAICGSAVVIKSRK